jgi:hypothetical protein
VAAPARKSAMGIKAGSFGAAGARKPSENGENYGTEEKDKGNGSQSGKAGGRNL